MSHREFSRYGLSHAILIKTSLITTEMESIQTSIKTIQNRSLLLQLLRAINTKITLVLYKTMPQKTKYLAMLNNIAVLITNPLTQL